MTIELYRSSLLNTIIELDKCCFQREKARTVTNVQTLISISDDGTFLLRNDKEYIGYVFTHCYGNVGTIGPIGIIEGLQNRGEGTALLKQAVCVLKKKGCSTIGLELLPQKGNNIGFYLKNDFVFVEPTLQMYLSSKIQSSCSRKVKDLREVDDYEVLRFFQRLAQLNNGYSLENDAIASINARAVCKLYYSNNEIQGVLFYHPELYPYVYGGILDTEPSRCVQALLASLQEAQPNTVLRVRFNTRYQMYQHCLPEGARFEHQLIRMVHKDGNRQALTDNILIFRSWVG